MRPTCPARAGTTCSSFRSRSAPTSCTIFDAAHDKIDVIGYAGLTSVADVQAHLANNAGGNAMLTLANGQLITFAGVDAGSLTADDFVFNQTPVTKQRRQHGD
jgi:hypothetical protein